MMLKPEPSASEYAEGKWLQNERGGWAGGLLRVVVSTNHANDNLFLLYIFT